MPQPTSQRFFLFAGFMLLGAIVCAIVPTHPLFNAPGGPFVLGSMSLFAAIAGILAWRSKRRDSGEKADACD